mgnify:CR=1 FL=1
MRLWFDRRVPTRFPANVLAGFEQDTGATFFDLNYLQVRLGGASATASPKRAHMQHSWNHTNLGYTLKGSAQLVIYSSALILPRSYNCEI